MKKIPLNVREAMITLKEFCIRQLNKATVDLEYCKDCPFNFTDGYDHECFFASVPPKDWDDIEGEEK